MVDWISCRVPCYLPFPVTGGMVVDHDEHGEIRFAVQKRLQCEGSFSSKIMVRAVTCEEIEISGNPAKFLQGHNLYGSADLRSVLRDVLGKVLPPIFGDMPPVYLDDAQFSRVDLTDGYLLEREGDVMAYLRGIEQTARISYKGRGVLDGSTLIYGRSNKGERAKAWQLVLYAKGKEVAKRPLPEPMNGDSEVIDWVNRLLRVELRLRGPELKRLGLVRLGDWTDEENGRSPEDVAAKTWGDYVAKLELSDVRQVETTELELIKPRLRNAYAAWKHGEDLSKGCPPRTFYRLRKEMRDHLGIDIAVPVPKSNVVPLVRVIEATPAHRPPWADRIDQILAA